MGHMFEVSLRGVDDKPIVSLHTADCVRDAEKEALENVAASGLIEGAAEIIETISPDAKGYIGEVIADNSGQWVGNGLTFATAREAECYVYDLASRWMMVQSTRVIPVKDEPTHFWSDDGKLGNLDRPEDARRPARSVQL